MTYHVFVTITGGKEPFKGESTMKGQENKFEAVSVSYGVISPAASAGSGAGAGKVQPQPVVITKNWGASSPQFFSTAFAGLHLRTVLIEYFLQSGDGASVLDHSVLLTDVVLTQVQDSFPSADGRELQSITLQYGKIQITIPNGATAGFDVAAGRLL
ncbi:MAG TPA: type VI secretion system tube protein Hcp [Edaphobacter sp.]